MRSLVFLLMGVAAAVAITTDHYKRRIRPFTEPCKKKLDVTDEEIDTFLHLHKHDFSHKLKCLAACVLEELQVMKEGRWGGVPAERRLEVYRAVFKDDPRRLEHAERVINVCHKEADDKHPGKGRGCDVAYHAIECFWELTS